MITEIFIKIEGLGCVVGVPQEKEKSCNKTKIFFSILISKDVVLFEAIIVYYMLAQFINTYFQTLDA